MATWGDSAAFTILADQADFSPAVLDAVPCLIAVVERESGDIVQLNRALEDVSGCSTAELSGRCWEEIIEPGDVDTMRAALLAPTGPVSGVETGLRTRSGEGRRVLWSLDSAGVTNDGTELVVLSGIDVTPELRTSGLFSQLMRTTAAPALVGTDVRGRVTLYNSAAEKMLGRSAASMIGRQLDVALFDAAEFAERAQRLGVPADLRLLAADLTKLDRRRSNLDLGPLDRRRRGSDEATGDDADRRGRTDDRNVPWDPHLDGDRRDSGARRPGTSADRRARSTSQARDWTLVRENGERFTASLLVVKVMDSSGEVVGFLGVGHDVTEQRKSRNLLVTGLAKEAEAVRRLETLDRAKDDFVATVSHELRTPITSILGYVELLIDAVSEQIDPTQVEMLLAVQRNGDRLRALADDLLTLSSFESGEFALNVTDVSLGEVVCRVQEALRPLLADRRLETTFVVPVDPVVVPGDVAHLERVLFNLLSNALKFTEDGGSVRCELRSEGDEAVLEVSDSGIGIPLEEQEQLFNRFFRSSTSQARAIQGTGMGLAIVASIVHRHRGRVQLTSADRQGTSVQVHLPTHAAV